jgi:hypothetical protein
MIFFATFAQAVMAAHACAGLTSTSSTVRAGSGTASWYVADAARAPPADCRAFPKSADRSGAGGNTCYSHCQAEYQVDSTQQIVSAAAVLAQTPIVVRSLAIAMRVVERPPQDFASTPPLVYFPKLLI